jgi:hypothetical protein
MVMREASNDGDVLLVEDNLLVAIVFQMIFYGEIIRQASKLTNN